MVQKREGGIVRKKYKEKGGEELVKERWGKTYREGERLWEKVREGEGVRIREREIGTQEKRDTERQRLIEKETDRDRDKYTYTKWENVCVWERNRKRQNMCWLTINLTTWSSWMLIYWGSTGFLDQLESHYIHWLCFNHRNII